MRVCGTCGKKKSDNAFAFKNKAKGTRHTSCKACKTIYNATWYEANKTVHRKATRRNRIKYKITIQAITDKRKNTPCTDCGRSYPPHAMDFHHVESSSKDQAVSALIANGAAIDRVEREIAKCLVLCAVCHRLRHLPEALVEGAPVF